MCPKRVVRAGLEISCPVSLQGWQLDQVRAVGKPCPIPISPKNFQAHPTQFPCDGITGEEARESDDIHLEGEASRFSVIAGPGFDPPRNRSGTRILTGLKVAFQSNSLGMYLPQL